MLKEAGCLGSGKGINESLMNMPENDQKIFQ
jgi:hypothetical protein